MIQLQEIFLAYEESKRVLNDISLNVNIGDTLCIVGASGAGKSTVLRVIAGLLPNKNTSFFSGEVKLMDNTPTDYLETGKLSFMFQDPSLLPNLTVRKNIAIPLKAKGFKSYEKVDELISLVGLNGFENYLPKQLSGGMKTRVSLARSFVTDPDVLLLDEPFSALDIGWKKILIEELMQIKKKLGTTLIMVTHDIQEAICLSNRFVVLGRNGKIIDQHTLGNNHVKENGYLDITRVPKYFPTDLSRIQTILSLDSDKKKPSKTEIESVLDLFLFYAGDDSHLDFFINMQPLLNKYFKGKSNEELVLAKINQIKIKATEKQKAVIQNVMKS